MSATAGIFGIGKGDAQVLQGNAGLSYLTQAYQQDQLRKQKEDAQFQAELAKINFDGARQADYDQLFDGYNGIRNKYSQLRSTQNPLERTKLLNQIEMDKRQLQQGINLSKQAGTAEQKYAQLRLDRNNDMKDDYGQQYTGLVKTSIFDPQYQQKAQYFNDPFHPQYDTDKLVKEIEPLVLKTTEGKQYARNVNGWNQLVRQDVTAVDEAAAKNLIIQKAAKDPSLLRSIMYKQAEGVTPERAVDDFANQMIQSMRARNTTKEKVLGSQAPERAKTPSWLEAWNLRHFGTPNAPKASSDDGRDLFIQQIESGDRLATDGLISSVTRAGGKLIPNKNGLEIKLPSTRIVNVYKDDANGNPTNEITGTKKISEEKSYIIPRDNSDKSKAATNEVLNELQLFKDRRMYVKKDHPYSSTAPAITAKPKQSSPKSSSMATVVLKNGQQGQIPSDQVQAFMKKYPGSKKL